MSTRREFLLHSTAVSLAMSSSLTGAHSMRNVTAPAGREAIEVVFAPNFTPPTGLLGGYGDAINHLCLHTTRIDEAFEHVKALGVAFGATVSAAPSEFTLNTDRGPVTGRVCSFLGPSGEVIELIQDAR